LIGRLPPAGPLAKGAAETENLARKRTGALLELGSIHELISAEFVPARNAKKTGLARRKGCRYCGYAVRRASQLLRGVDGLN
jgi:hypothetical protein